MEATSMHHASKIECSIVYYHRVSSAVISKGVLHCTSFPLNQDTGQTILRCTQTSLYQSLLEQNLQN